MTRRCRSSSPRPSAAKTAALSLLLVVGFAVALAPSPASAARLLSSSDAGAPLPLVGEAFEASGADAATAPGQVSAEAFRGVGARRGSDGGDAAAAAASEPLPEGSPNLSETAVPSATTAAPTATTETTTPPTPTTETTPPTTPAATPPPAPSAPLLPPLAVSPEGRLTAGGQPIELKGLNWFGFEAGQTFVDGTSWSGTGSALSHDAMTVLWRMKLLGFNSVRLPFSFAEFDKKPRDVTSKCDRVSAEDVARSAAPPGVALRPEVLAGGVPPLMAPSGGSSQSTNEGHGGSASLTLPAPVGTPSPTRGHGGGPWESKVDCNADVPSSSVKERLLWLVKKCVAAGFYVMLDDHISYDTTILDDPSKWVSKWRELAADLAAEPSLAGAVMLDLVNEPDSRGIRWSTGPNNSGVGMQTLYVQAMDAIAEVNPWALLLVEGCGQLGNLAMNWGDGFATDPAVLSAAEGGPQSAAPFFDAVVSRPYASRVVLAPHVYPPSVSQQKTRIDEPELTRRLDSSFGHLGPRGKGYCGNGTSNGTSPTCRKFPILIGEVGSKLEDPRDVLFLEAFASYLSGGSEEEKKADGVFWWSWNANSGDTGGIVADDWVSLRWAKLAWMNAATRLEPWYVSALAEGAEGGEGGLPFADTSVPTPAATPAATEATPPPATTTPPPTLPPPPATATATPPPPATETPPPPATETPVPPSPTQRPLQPPPELPHPPTATDGAADGAEALTCLALVLSARPVDSSTSPPSPSHEVTLAITSATPVSAPYNLELYAPGYGALRTARGWVPSDGGSPTAGVLRGTVPEKWQGLGGGMGAVTLSYVVRGGPSGAEGAPSAVAVNGAPCAVAKA